MEEETAGSRRKRKEEGKRLKRQRIEKSGGVRPRQPEDPQQQQQSLNTAADPHRPETATTDAAAAAANKSNTPRGGRGPGKTVNSSKKPMMKQPKQQHRFGRVMEQVPCRGQPRTATVSIAIPGSIVANCQTRELKTQITGQMARAATIYHVDEIIVFDDGLAKRRGGGVGSYHHRPHPSNHNNRHGKNSDNQHESKVEDPQSQNGTEGGGDHARPEHARQRPPSDPHAFMARILQYAECPQYLRRHFFPMHPDLQFVGLLPPVDAPHHVREDDRCPFREGVVLPDKTTTTTTQQHAKGSLVNCGIRGRPVHIDQKLQPGIRCTIQLDPASYGRPGPLHGTVVSPSTPTRTDGTYWGYTVRLADSIQAVLDQCPYPEGTYDLTIGTSERGSESIDDADFTLLSTKRNRTMQQQPQQPPQYFQHALIVFGGIAGIEECVDADERMKLSGSNAHELFDKWVNVCPFQGSRTIRSEEAVLLALARLSPFLAQAAASPMHEKKKASKSKNEPTPIAVQFSDAPLSEESSSDDDSATSPEES